MCKIIQIDYGRMISFNDMNMISKDGRITQRRLINKIHLLSKIICGKSQDAYAVAQSVIQSFCINGIMDTYNDLGYDNWKEMIIMMIEHEIYERSA